MPLLIAAMLFSALMPQGFMPSFSADGFTIKLCSGTQNDSLHVSRSDPQFELIALVNGIDLDTLPSDDSKNTDTPCAFAGMPVFAQPPQPPAIMASGGATAIMPVRNYQSLGAYRHAQTPPSTGPPFFI